MSNPPYMMQQQSPLWFPELQDDFLESEATFGTSQRTWGQQDSSSACFYARGPALPASSQGVPSLGGYYSDAQSSHLRGTPSSYYHRPQDPTTTDGLEGDLARLSLTRAGSRDSSLGGSSTGTWASDWSGFHSCHSAATTAPGGGPVGAASQQHRRGRSRHATHHNKAMDSSDAAHILQCLFHEENGATDWQR